MYPSVRSFLKTKMFRELMRHIKNRIHSWFIGDVIRQVCRRQKQFCSLLHKLRDGSTLSLLANLKGHSLSLLYSLDTTYFIAWRRRRKSNHSFHIHFLTFSLRWFPCASLVGVTSVAGILSLATFKVERTRCQKENRQRGQGPLYTIKCRDLQREFNIWREGL